MTIDAPAAAKASTPADEPARVVLGKVLGAFGIKGWVKVQPLSRDPGSLLAHSDWGLVQRDAVREVRVEEVKEHGGTILARLAGIVDRSEAEALRGAEVTVLRGQLPDALPGEYYWSDLIGLAVENVDGVLLGRVAGLIEAPAHDVLRVATGDEGNREQLIPFVEPIVRGVDVARGAITVEWQKDY
jgi:16S rRNA processing protein RimM